MDCTVFFAKVVDVKGWGGGGGLDVPSGIPISVARAKLDR